MLHRIVGFVFFRLIYLTRDGIGWMGEWVKIVKNLGTCQWIYFDIILNCIQLTVLDKQQIIMFITHFSKPSHHPIWYPEWTFRVNPQNQIPTRREIRYVYIKIVLCGLKKKIFLLKSLPKNDNIKKNQEIKTTHTINRTLSYK